MTKKKSNPEKPVRDSKGKFISKESKVTMTIIKPKQKSKPKKLIVNPANALLIGFDQTKTDFIIGDKISDNFKIIATIHDAKRGIISLKRAIKKAETEYNLSNGIDI